MGYGQIGQHRHSGQQGGHGNAGLHKHKWSWMMIHDRDHFKRDQYAVPGAHKVSKWLNVGELESMLTGKVRRADFARPHFDGCREAPRLW